MRGDTTFNHYIEPIADLLEHPDVTDIVINRPKQVYYRQQGSWQTRIVEVFDFEMLDALTILIGQRTGREFDEGHPYVNSTLPDGQRFQGVRPPGTKHEHVLWAIRRPPTVARKVEDDDFPLLFKSTNTGTGRRQQARQDVAMLYRDKDYVRLLPAARRAGLSIALCGVPGSGKTDGCRRLLQVYRPGTRIVSIETDDEFGEAGPDNRASLLYDDAQVTSDEAVRITLRLVPDEIALQEVRGAEAYTLLRAGNSGMSLLTTWHADEGREIDALVMMARQHPAGRSEDADRLRDMARQAFDLIAYCQRTDERSEGDAGFRISSIKLTAAEEENV